MNSSADWLTIIDQSVRCIKQVVNLECHIRPQKTDMIIRTKAIPHEGRSIEFDLDTKALNDRINIGRNAKASHPSVLPPVYAFCGAPRAELFLTRAGTSVEVSGDIRGKFSSPCSRCMEDLEVELSVRISITLKPKRAGDEEIEDLNFGYYVNEEIDCAEIAEENLILQLPFRVTCSAPSIEECPRASEAMKYSYREHSEKQLDPRLAALRDIKLNS